MRQRSVTQTITMAETSDDVLWNSELHHAYDPYKLVMKTMGIWPYTCQSIGALSMAIFACVTQITMIIFIIGETLISNSSMNLQVMAYLSCNFLSLIKIILLRLNWNRIRYILDNLIAAWKCVTSPENLKKTKRNAELGRNICIYQMGSTYFVCLPTMITALPIFLPISNDTLNSTSMIRSLPLQTPQFFANISSEAYVIIFIYQCIQIIYTCTGNVGNDVCFFGIAMNLSAQFECLAFDIENISGNENESLKKRTLSIYIETQVKLIKMAEDLATTFSFIALAIVCVNCSQICLYGIEVLKSIKSGNIVLICDCVICMMILLLQIFLYCYAGDRLSEAIANLGDAAYKCSWYKMTADDRKEIIFIVMRTHKIFSLTAGKMYCMDLESFKSIVKAIGSYFSVMKAMFEE